jgi:Holliday junction resolvase RusA-like endonuclease
VNVSTRNVPGKGRVKTKAYKDWRHTAEWMLKAKRQKIGANKSYSCRISATRPDKRRRDIDNFIKPVVDALVASGIVPDDCQMEAVSATWVTGCPDRVLLVEVEECPES